MKKSILMAIPCLILVSCWGRHGNAEDTTDSEATEYSYRTWDEDVEAGMLDGQDPHFSSKGPSSSTKVHELRDAKTGLTVNSTEYPAHWTVISKPSYTIDQKLPTFLIQITGPNGLKNFNTPVRYHVYYQDAQMAQVMRNTPYGQLIRPLVDPKQIFEEEVRTRMVNSGFNFLGERKRPDLARYLRNKLNSKSQMDTSLSMYDTEWENSSGQKAMASVSLISMQQPTISGSMIVWFYSVDYTFVEGKAYEATLEQMKAAAFSYKENPQWERYVAQLGQQRAAENQRRAQMAAAQHQNRMQARWAAFNAHQEKMKGIWAAQDANHASFMNRNFGTGSGTGQSQFINMINEEETVHNPLTGHNYQVDAGSTEYWMDSDGNYIRNDDLFYTPNGDINLNHREWVKVEGAY